MATSKWQNMAKTMGVEYLAPNLPEYGEDHTQKGFDFDRWSADADKSNEEATRLNKLAKAGILEDFPCIMIGKAVSETLVHVRLQEVIIPSDDDIAASLDAVERFLAGEIQTLPSEVATPEIVDTSDEEIPEQQAVVLSDDEMLAKLADIDSFLVEFELPVAS